MATTIKGKPKKKVTLPAPTRSGNNIVAKWKNPKGTGKRPFQSIYVLWHIDGSTGTDKDKTNKKGKSDTSDTLKLSRADWYPKTKRKLNKVTAKVRGHNTKGYGPWQGPKGIAFAVPDPPALSVSVGTGADAGKVTVSMTAAESTPEKELYDTCIKVTRTANFGKKSESLLDTITTNGTYSKSFDIADAQTLDKNQWITVTITAYSRGLKGDSKDATPKSHTFAWPATAEITGIKCANEASKAGMVIVSLKTNHSGTHPVDTVQLQRLTSSAASTKEQAAVATGWQDVTGAIDNKNCTGLTDELADAYPDNGTRTWYRLKTVHDTYTVLGEPVQLDVYNPVAPSSVGLASITSATIGKDGTSVTLGIEWTESDDDFVEISYSEHEDAWTSNARPDTQDVDWGVDQTATCTIHDLTEGTTYYFRVRCYDTNSEGEGTYGEYSATVAITPVSSPSQVTLNAPSYVAVGKPITVTWTHDATAQQTAYRLFDNTGKVWADGTGAAGTYTIPADQLTGLTSVSLAVAVTTGGDWVDSTTVRTVSGGTEETVTDVYQTVSIVSPPTLQMVTGATLTVQPLTLTLTTDLPSTSATVSVQAVGGDAELPDGTLSQAEGDVIWSEISQPTWTEVEGVGYTATIAAPDGLALYEPLSYVVSASVTDIETGLTSPTVTQLTEVAWAHQADAPDAIVRTNEGALSATITTVPPTGYQPTIYELTSDVEVDPEKTYYVQTQSGYEEVEEPKTADIGTYYEFVRTGDLCDVYRVTPWGVELIAEGVEFGTTVVDPWAPYSNPFSDIELSYRIACRTADGDVAWTDAEYILECGAVRLDWGDAIDGESVELPYNLVISEEHGRESTATRHMDGKYSGHIAAGVSREFSLSTALISVKSAGERNSLLDAIAHDGCVFVRTPSGTARDCILRKISTEESHDSALLSVSITATGVELTDEHRAVSA